MSSETLKASPKKTKSARRIAGYGLVAVALVAVCAGVVVFLRPDGPGRPYVELGGEQLLAEVADTDSARTQGLSGREGLAHDEGMLFVFDRAGRYCFWMKDMKFVIDLFWLDETGKVVHVVEGAAPESYPKQFCSETDAKYVFEVNAGIASKLGAGKGSQAIVSY